MSRVKRHSLAIEPYRHARADLLKDGQPVTRFAQAERL
jgi:hypothetical protein